MDQQFAIPNYALISNYINQRQPIKNDNYAEEKNKVTNAGFNKYILGHNNNRLNNLMREILDDKESDFNLNYNATDESDDQEEQLQKEPSKPILIDREVKKINKDYRKMKNAEKFYNFHQQGRVNNMKSEIIDRIDDVETEIDDAIENNSYYSPADIAQLNKYRRELDKMKYNINSRQQCAAFMSYINVGFIVLILSVLIVFMLLNVYYLRKLRRQSETRPPPDINEQLNGGYYYSPEYYTQYGPRPPPAPPAPPKRIPPRTSPRDIRDFNQYGDRTASDYPENLSGWGYEYCD